MSNIMVLLFQTPLIFTQLLTLCLLCFMLFKGAEWIKKQQYSYLVIGSIALIFLLWLSMVHTRAFLCKPAIIGPHGTFLYAGTHTCSTQKMELSASTPVLVSTQQHDWCKVIVDGAEGWVPADVLMIES